MGMREVLYRLLVAFGAACVGVFVGMVGSAALVIDLNLAVAITLGLAVMGAIASFAVEIPVKV